MADRVALVTGAARGIGASVAGALSTDGCAVALFDADPIVVETAKELAGTGAATIGSVVDVTNIAAVELGIAGVERDLGPIDVLANVAGVLRRAPILDAADADWAACLAVNATGVWNAGRAVGRRMRARGRAAHARARPGRHRHGPDLEAFATLVDGVASGDSALTSKRFAAASSDLAEAVAATGAMQTESGEKMTQLFGAPVVAAVMVEMNQIQTRGVIGEGVRESPVLPGGLVPSADGLGWAAPGNGEAAEPPRVGAA